MKVAVVGSRDLTNITLDQYIPKETDEIVSGGAVGVDLCAAEYAKKKRLRLTEFLPQYERYGRAAPIVRNKKIVDYADKSSFSGTEAQKERNRSSNTPKKSASILKLYFVNKFFLAKRAES